LLKELAKMMDINQNPDQADHNRTKQITRRRFPQRRR
jgi:hypothetical protein